MGKDKSKQAEAEQDIKKRMALPPIPQPPVRDKSNRGRSDRIRMEISLDQCAGFIAMLGERLRHMGVDEPEFKPLYAIYFSLKSQSDKFNSKEGK